MAERTGGNQDLWTTVDHFFGDLTARHDDALDAALAASAAAGLPEIQVSQNQGKLLHTLARTIGAKRILEIGTLGGYSTIWMARALPARGRLITLEYDPKHAAVAKLNLERAGVADLVDVRVGPAIESLPHLAAEAPFDFVFIDADKPSTSAYFDWALRLTRPGSLIIVDNVVRDGQVVDPSSTDPGVVAMRRFAELVAREPRVTAAVTQTVSAKGYDGFLTAFVNA